MSLWITYKTVNSQSTNIKMLNPYWKKLYFAIIYQKQITSYHIHNSTPRKIYLNFFIELLLQVLWVDATYFFLEI